MDRHQLAAPAGRYWCTARLATPTQLQLQPNCNLTSPQKSHRNVPFLSCTEGAQASIWRVLRTAPTAGHPPYHPRITDPRAALHVLGRRNRWPRKVSRSVRTRSSGAALWAPGPEEAISSCQRMATGATRSWGSGRYVDGNTVDGNNEGQHHAGRQGDVGLSEGKSLKPVAPSPREASHQPTSVD